MKTINLGEGYRIEVNEVFRQVSGYEPGWVNEAISLCRNKIEDCRPLPVNITSGKKLLELYLRCVEEYEKLQ